MDLSSECSWYQQCVEDVAVFIKSSDNAENTVSNINVDIDDIDVDDVDIDDDVDDDVDDVDIGVDNT